MLSQQKVGAVLDDKYEILQQLGSGGMGDLYLVRHLYLEQKRVIKVLRQELASDESAQKRFLREARLSTEIKHPNVATLYDYASLPDGSFYMVWEYIEGEDVGDWIDSRGPFPLEIALQLGIQALQGLEAIHAVGVIHRDISPDNLMITRTPQGPLQIKIIDLGLAKNLVPDPNYEVTQAGMFMGKLQYCSPEQAGMVKGQNLDHRSDLYSFAMVLYEMICGLPPFDADNAHGFIFKRLSEDPIPLMGRNSEVEVPHQLDLVVRRGLARDRNQRYSDAATFIAALEEVRGRMNLATTQQIPVAAPPPPPPSRPAAPRRPSEMTHEEREELLAQIDRAARRVKQTSTLVLEAEEALKAGEVARARDLTERIEADHPRASGLATLKKHLEEAERAAAGQDRQTRVREAEKMLERYLQQRQKTLAGLALDALLELVPNHPRQAEFQDWVRLVGEEAQEKRRCEEALTSGRAALARGDLKAARKQLEIAARHDPSGEMAESFQEELAAAERDRAQSADAERERERFEGALDKEDFEGARKALDGLGKLGLSRATLVTHQDRLQEAIERARREALEASFEESLRERLAARDWDGAREVVHELGKALPKSDRPAKLFAEVSRLEEQHRREEALLRGVEQVETFVASGDPDRAALALKVLLQMAPHHPRRQQLEKKIQALRG